MSHVAYAADGSMSNTHTHRQRERERERERDVGERGEERSRTRAIA